MQHLQVLIPYALTMAIAPAYSFSELERMTSNAAVKSACKWLGEVWAGVAAYMIIVVYLLLAAPRQFELLVNLFFNWAQ
jgi:hypothetical protein